MYISDTFFRQIFLNLFISEEEFSWKYFYITSKNYVLYQ